MEGSQTHPTLDPSGWLLQHPLPHMINISSLLHRLRRNRRGTGKTLRKGSLADKQEAAPAQKKVEVCRGKVSPPGPGGILPQKNKAARLKKQRVALLPHFLSSASCRSRPGKKRVWRVGALCHVLSKSDGGLVLPQVVGNRAKGGDGGRDLGAIHGR